MLTILHIVGTRPNFIKLYAVARILSKNDRIKQVIVNTGQHFDKEMSSGFFEQLDIPRPTYDLLCGNLSIANRMAKIFKAMEQIVIVEKPDLCIVYGDVDSTLAGAIICSKLGIPIAHIEAGLRSFDTTMPEEVNRKVTDHLSTLLFTHCLDADNNLHAEGIYDGVHFVGNVMIDTLVDNMQRIENVWDKLKDSVKLMRGDYCLVTLHRKALFTHPETLPILLVRLNQLSRSIPVLFPAHPNTCASIQKLNFSPESNFVITKPMNYLEFIAVQKHAEFVLTDSGGVQEETTYLNVPCFTIRNNTERPITVTEGTNKLVGLNFSLDDLTTFKKSTSIALWDGKASERINEVISKVYAI
jgi:UDP-N-acetylglucosamine 2-epimerase (non-hydrolysing)